MTTDGIPIGHEVFPGNIHDTRAFAELIPILDQRFTIVQAMLFADRGLVSKRILAGFDPQDIFRAYCQLYQVERALREVKGPFELRPVRRVLGRRIRGPMMLCFLA